MNKIDIVRAVKNQQKIFTPEFTGCVDQISFRHIAEAIVETKTEGYISGEIKQVLAENSNQIERIIVEAEVTQLGEDLLEIEEAKGSIY